MQERQVPAHATAEVAAVTKLLKDAGGVCSTGKADHGEWEPLPASVRRVHGRLTLDGARELVMEHFPWLHLDTPDDLVQFYERVRRHALPWGAVA
jgi:hypothetical protein